jgi:hemoglobin
MAAASSFYEKVLGDPDLAPFFVSLDMDQQVAKQVAFLSWAFGGPERYAFRPLGAAHARLRAQGLTDVHFDRVVGHLADTLRELSIPDDLIEEALRIVEGTRAEVLGR